MSLDEPTFLTVEDVIYLHDRGIKRYGGDSGIRDIGLVESATKAAQATFGGEFLHTTIASMAAAYWFNLSGNHGFVDGNKRVALYACDTFLTLNGYELTLADKDVLKIGLQLAKGELSKEELTQRIAHAIRDSG